MMKKTNLLIFTLIICFFNLFSISAFALSPPWYLLRAQLKASLDADPCVQVGKLTGQGRNMEIAINVCDYNKALALATLVSKKHEFGDKILVSVNVISANRPIPSGALPTSLDQALQLLNHALDGNQFFVKVGSSSFAERGFVEFKPMVVQYYSDDISDWYGNTNLIASEAFKRILKLDEWNRNGVFVITTTSRLNKF